MKAPGWALAPALTLALGLALGLIAGLAASLAPSLASGQGPAAWTITTITECRRGESSSPRISAAGNIVFFISTCDLAGDNFDQNAEIFQWEDGQIIQLTDTRNCRFSDLALSPDDRRLAFTTDCTINPDRRGPEFQIAVMTDPGKIKPVTQALGFSCAHPAWFPKQNRIAFDSAADLAGQNPDHNIEIFTADLADPDTVTIKQISQTSAPGWCEQPQPANNSIITLCSTDLPGTGDQNSNLKSYTADGQPTYGNPDRNHELYALGMDGSVIQLTATINCGNGAPRISPAGSAAAFFSDCPQAGANLSAAKNTLYLLTPAIVPVFANFSFNASAPALSADNLHLTLTSNYGNAAFNQARNQQIFTITLPLPAHQANPAGLSLPQTALLPITTFDRGNSYDPAISRDGNAIAFVTTADPDRSNNDANPEICIAIRNQ